MNIYRKSQQELTRRAAHEAAEWLGVMNADPSADEREAFTAWVAASPLHVREMLLVGMLDQELGKSAVLDQFDVDAIVAEAKAGSNVVQLPASARRTGTTGRRPRARSLRWSRAVGIAAVLLLAVASWVGLRGLQPAGVEYATVIGEHRAITLNDGTRVTMAPDSRISVNFSPDTRAIKLRQGEAEFDVVHNASRPFRVYAGTSMIQDVGTQFSVNRLPSGTVVSVTEGRVAVTASHLAALDNGIGSWMDSWLPDGSAAIERPGVKVQPLDKPLSLGAGEVAHISRGGHALTRGTFTADDQAPVDARRLTFHGDTLADIAAEFNRYNTRQIVVEGDSVKLQRYSGVFDANDAASFLQFLDCCSPLTVVRDGNHMVIQRRSSAQDD